MLTFAHVTSFDHQLHISMLRQIYVNIFFEPPQKWYWKDIQDLFCVFYFIQSCLDPLSADHVEHVALEQRHRSIDKDLEDNWLSWVNPMHYQFNIHSQYTQYNIHNTESFEINNSRVVFIPLEQKLGLEMCEIQEFFLILKHHISVSAADPLHRVLKVHIIPTITLA